MNYQNEIHESIPQLKSYFVSHYVQDVMEKGHFLLGSEDVMIGQDGTQYHWVAADGIFHITACLPQFPLTFFVLFQAVKDGVFRAKEKAGLATTDKPHIYL